MNPQDINLQKLRDEVSALQLRLGELVVENRDLRDICDESGIQYEERLAARRHNRYFARLCAEHPIETTVVASDILGAAPIVRRVAEFAGSVLRPALVARDFFAAFTELTAQFPWRFGGGRLSATFEGHASFVLSLAVLQGGRLASGSDDHTIKVWELANGACVAALEGHDDDVYSLAVLEGGRLASGSDDQQIKMWESALLDTLR